MNNTLKQDNGPELACGGNSVGTVARPRVACPVRLQLFVSRAQTRQRLVPPCAEGTSRRSRWDRFATFGSWASGQAANPWSELFPPLIYRDEAPWRGVEYRLSIIVVWLPAIGAVFWINIHFAVSFVKIKSIRQPIVAPDAFFNIPRCVLSPNTDKCIVGISVRINVRCVKVSKVFRW